MLSGTGRIANKGEATQIAIVIMEIIKLKSIQFCAPRLANVIIHTEVVQAVK